MQTRPLEQFHMWMSRVSAVSIAQIYISDFGQAVGVSEVLRGIRVLRFTFKLSEIHLLQNKLLL